MNKENVRKDKAFLKLAGRPLIEHSLRVLQTVFAEVLISANSPERYVKYNVPVVVDEIPGRGPLEGLFRGLKAAAYDEVFFVACDMPFLNPDLIRRMAKWAGAYDIVIPRFQSGSEAGLHPLHAFYHRRCLPAIERSLAAGRLKISSIFSESSIRYVGESELVDFPNLSRIFCNVNTLEDWSAILQSQTGREG